MKKIKRARRPNSFGPPEYPAFGFHIESGTVQVVALRQNAALYLEDFKKFHKWLDRVQAYADYEFSKKWRQAFLPKGSAQ